MRVLHTIRNTHWRAGLPRFSLLVAGIGALMLGGCPRSGDKAPEYATIAYIGNFRGFQRPCGCATEQYGERVFSVSRTAATWSTN